MDRCVSFDGQGFSDEFMEEYENRIALNEGKIENHNVDCDYVNILLNDIGTTTYYESQDIGNPLEFHCPNSFFDFGEDGSVTLHETEQNPIMQKIDQALNSILRTLSDDEKEQFLDTFGEIFQVAMGGSGRSIVSILSDVSDRKLLAYVLILLGLYVECNLLDASVVGYVLSYFDIDLTAWIPDGSDIQVNSLSVGAEIAFAVNPAIMLQIEEELVNQNAELEGYAERVEKVGKKLKGIYLTLGWAVSSQANKISKYGTFCTKMADALDNVAEQYQKTEQLCMIEQ
ncbi:MAG: hypothetical protein LIO86_03170 [Lachnospiraceae bacterium]|nr:hypothetical protein [Lachnospiraceae bacterium]